MLYSLLYSLHNSYSAFNVMKYITFRTLCAAVLSFLIAFAFGPWLIRKLTELQVGQQIRSDGPASHQTKAGTPTMGGTLILLSLVLSTVLLADLTNFYVWLVVGVTVSFGAVGFVDDWRKLRRKAKAPGSREADLRCYRRERPLASATPGTIRSPS